jgi:ABC-type microcin C transport system permease subunit YejB
MAQMDETDLVYKGPWVRNAQQRLIKMLESDYAFPRATCRPFVNLMLDFVNETFGEELHQGQIVFHAASASEPPSKRNLVNKIGPIPSDFT